LIVQYRSFHEYRKVYVYEADDDRSFSLLLSEVSLRSLLSDGRSVFE
jgi:hypothetical protein